MSSVGGGTDTSHMCWSCYFLDTAVVVLRLLHYLLCFNVQCNCGLCVRTCGFGIPCGIVHFCTW